MSTTIIEPETITSEEIIPYEDTDDGQDHRAHIINPPGNTHIWRPGMSAQDIVDIARATGQQVVALCGYKWVPKRNPDKYDACETCMNIAGMLMRENGE